MHNAKYYSDLANDSISNIRTKRMQSIENAVHKAAKDGYFVMTIDMTDVKDDLNYYYMELTSKGFKVCKTMNAILNSEYIKISWCLI